MVEVGLSGDKHPEEFQTIAQGREDIEKEKAVKKGHSVRLHVHV